MLAFLCLLHSYALFPLCDPNPLLAPAGSQRGHVLCNLCHPLPVPGVRCFLQHSLEPGWCFLPLPHWLMSQGEQLRYPWGSDLVLL